MACFKFNHSFRCLMMTHGRLSLNYLMSNDVKNHFLYILNEHLDIILCHVPNQSFILFSSKLEILVLVFVFFSLVCGSFFTCIMNTSLWQIDILPHLQLWGVFSFGGIFWQTEIFNFSEVEFINFLLICSAFMSCLRNICLLQIRKKAVLPSQ